MSRSLAVVLVWSAGFACCARLPGADSGPAAGTAAAPFRVQAVTGDGAGSPVDPLAQRGDRPTLYCFVS